MCGVGELQASSVGLVSTCMSSQAEHNTLNKQRAKAGESLGRPSREEAAVALRAVWTSGGGDLEVVIVAVCGEPEPEP